MDPPLHHKNLPSPPKNPSTERLPQWTHAETRELLAARSELDASFAESKRNRALWEAVAARLQRKGFLRNPEQCKSKWKNLVTRFKGSDAMEGSSDRFPFQDEMRSIFAGRTERLLRLDRGKRPVVEADNEEEEATEQKFKKKRKKKATAVTTKEGEVEAALRELAKRQMEMEVGRIEAAEAREAERRSKEEEWRREMETLAEERAATERRWMEREEERRAAEEARDERRHAVIAAIASRLANNRGD